MPDLDKLQPIANRIIDQYFLSGLSSLEPKDQVFLLAWSHGPQLDNGGHASFFYNSQADNYVETVAALKLLGLDLFSDLLERAAAVLFNGPVPDNMTARNEIIDALPDDPQIDAELQALDDQFYENGGGDRVLDDLDRWYADQRN